MLSLIGIPTVLAIGAALQLFGTYRAQAAKWLLFAGAAVALAFVLIGLPAAIAGNGAQVTLANPIPGVAVSFVATASGYSILGLALCAALLLLAHEDLQRNHATLLLSLTGVAIACLGGSLFTLACGSQIVAASALIGLRSPEPGSRARLWLEAGVLQVAVGCLIGAACWYQLQVSTTSFSVLPASAASVASLAWALGIALLVVACAMAGSVRSKGLSYTVITLSPLIVLNAVRLDQVASNGLGSISVQPLLIVGCLVALISVVRIWQARALRDCAHWFWLAAFVPLLFVTAVQDPTGSALGAQAVTLVVSGVLLSLIDTSATLGVTKSLALLAVIGLPFGAALPGWISSFAVLRNSTSAQALAWVLVVLGALIVIAGLRMVLRSRGAGVLSRQRNLALLPIALICIFVSLLPGLMATSIFAWIDDASAPSTTAFSLPLAGGRSWPGGLIAAICLAATIMVFSAATILGMSLRKAGNGDADTSVASAPERWRHVATVIRKIGATANNIDDWLAVEPRLVTVVLAGAAALAVFR